MNIIFVVILQKGFWIKKVAARIEFLKNKRIIWMEEIRLYILSINIKNSNFILGTKIEI